MRYAAIAKNGTFWLATRGGGLIHWTPNFENNTSTFEQFTTKDGLSHDYLYAVFLDDNQNLWIPSDKGLMYFNVSNENIMTFLEEDGLPHNEFNRTAHYQTKDGEIYLGTLGGFFHFNPKNLTNSLDYNAPLQLKKVSVLEGNAEKMSDYRLTYLQQKQIVIQPNHKMLELDFSLLDFNRNVEKRYRYIIEGYAKSWTTIEQGILRINSLPYGKYKLRIQGQNIKKGWSSEELIIPIVVVRPFYLQWCFFVLIGLVLIFGIYRFIKSREARLLAEKDKLETIVQQRTAKIQKDKKVIENQAGELKEQAEELKLLNVTQRRFFANITHEFRTPLTLVIGPLRQLMKKHLPQDVTQQHKMMLKNAQLLQILINQLLDLAKLESGQMKVETAQGDLIEFTKDLVAGFQSMALSKQQTLRFHSSEKVLNAHFDREKWNKILYNLISNAIKFTPNDGEIQVELIKLPKVKNTTEKVHLIVRDNGIGIHKEMIKNVFKRFYQVDGSTKRTQEGSGIGLSLVKELVKLQDGEIKISSEVGNGTTFEVELPLMSKLSVLSTENKVIIKENSAISISPILTEDIQLMTSQPSTANKKGQLELLIIEDNADMQQYIINCFEPFNYKITLANNGVEGIEKAFEIIPDLIISDIMMPHKDGYEVTTEIRKNVATSHIPIVLLTAKASLESRLEGLERGADAYLTKPFNPEELIVRIEKLIELRQLIQNRYQDGTTVFLSKTDDFPTLKSEDVFIQKLQQLILENLNNTELNGDWLSKEFYMSRTNFYRKVKTLTNCTVGKYINLIRLQEAKKIVLTQNLTLSAAAYDVGFSSPSNFSKVCKRITGKSPREFMKAKN